MIAKRLEIVTNVVVLLAAVSILAFNVAPRFFAEEPPPTTRRPYEAGDTIAETPELKFGQPTFILNTASKCRYCTESMPFYQRLVAAGARVIAVSQEPPDINRTYLQSHNVSPAVVLSAADNGLKFRATPSLLLVNERGVVEATWWGKQNEAGEDDILGRVK